MIVLYGGDRSWRLALDGAFRSAGLAVRTASRQAEFAKCLTDALATDAREGGALVIAGPSRDDEAVVRAAVAILAPALQSDDRVVTTTPGESITEIVRRAQLLLAR